MTDIVGLLLPFFGLIFIGYGAARITKQPVEAMGWLNTFIIYAALPALFFKLVSKTRLKSWRAWISSLPALPAPMAFSCWYF